MSGAEKITEHARIEAWPATRGVRPARAPGAQDGPLRFAFGRDGAALAGIGRRAVFDPVAVDRLALPERRVMRSCATSRVATFVAR